VLRTLMEATLRTSIPWKRKKTEMKAKSM